MNTYLPKRIAVLIGAQAAGANMLAVEMDLQSQEQFLLSVNGGAWYQHEIKIFNNDPFFVIASYIQHIQADYVYIYFSGHGFSYSMNERYLCVGGQDSIMDYQLAKLAPCSKVRLVCDCCRTRLSKPGTIGGINRATNRWREAAGINRARANFDRYIIASPPGIQIIHAIGDASAALENAAGHGGEFTLALMEVINDLQLSGSDFILTPEATIYLTTKKLYEKGIRRQYPAFFNEEGKLQIPIAQISSEYTIPQQQKTYHQWHPQKETGDAILAAAVILGLCVILSD